MSQSRCLQNEYKIYPRLRNRAYTRSHSSSSFIIPSMPFVSQTSRQTQGSALCVKHFLHFAQLHHIGADPEVFNNTVPSIEETLSSAGRTNLQPMTPATPPTRVQPRRAAKDKVLRAQALNRKRQADEDADSAGPSKRQKTVHIDLGSWENCALYLLQVIYQDLRDDRDKCECCYGPKPWVCEMCEPHHESWSQHYDLVEGKYHQPRAPVADMSPIGEDLYIASWANLHPSQQRHHHFGRLNFIVDNCRGPMVLVL